MRLGLNATLTTGSADNFPANYASCQIAQNSTVNYNSAGAQTVSALGGASYGNISFSGGGTNNRTLAGRNHSCKAILRISAAGLTLELQAIIALTGGWKL
ncbi:MAG: hypothetical protein RML35_09835 [Chloroherpetonaceae bacterium]|nr:hypothetical protein [Chloroherpetonaceae bacterium]